jgi:hypothetical protein
VLRVLDGLDFNDVVVVLSIHVLLKLQHLPEQGFILSFELFVDDPVHLCVPVIEFLLEQSPFGGDCRGDDGLYLRFEVPLRATTSSLLCRCWSVRLWRSTVAISRSFRYCAVRISCN